MGFHIYIFLWRNYKYSQNYYTCSKLILILINLNFIYNLYWSVWVISGVLKIASSTLIHLPQNYKNVFYSSKFINNSILTPQTEGRILTCKRATEGGRGQPNRRPDMRPNQRQNSNRQHQTFGQQARRNSEDESPESGELVETEQI